MAKSRAESPSFTHVGKNFSSYRCPGTLLLLGSCSLTSCVIFPQPHLTKQKCKGHTRSWEQAQEDRRCRIKKQTKQWSKNTELKYTRANDQMKNIKKEQGERQRQEVESKTWPKPQAMYYEIKLKSYQLVFTLCKTLMYCWIKELCCRKTTSYCIQ